MPFSKFPKLELKYCERCGGLRLRTYGSHEVYCARCAQAISEMPAAHRFDHEPRNTIARVAGCVIFLAALVLAESAGGALA